MLEGEKVSACLSRMGKHKDKAILNTLMDTLDLVAIQHGDLEVYDYNKEKMHKVIKAEEEKNSRKKPTLSKKSTFFREDGVKVNDEVWEFEWVGKEGKVEGPVSLLQLKEWTDKKCFDVAKIIFWLKTKKSDRTHSNDLSEVFAVYGL